jgi:hypothetical protein
MTERLVVIRRIDKYELPHLTISFQNASDEIDLHLKNENPASPEQQYKPLVRVSKARVGQFLEMLSPRFEEECRLLFSKVERVRPRWLISRGYVIGLIHTKNFQSEILRTAPKHRGKYRVNTEALKRLFRDIDQSAISLLDPSVLHSDELKNWREPILAARAWGKDKLIALRYAPLKGSFHQWIRIDPIANELPRIFQRLVPPEISKEVTDVWHKVHDALQLDELDISR